MASTVHRVRVQGERLFLTNHAIERYGERVRPGLEFPQLVAELGKLLEAGGEFGAERPVWATGDLTACGWVTLGDSIAFPVMEDRLMTCLDKHGAGAEVRVVRAKLRGEQAARREGKRRRKHAKGGKVARGERRRARDQREALSDG